MTLNAKLLLFYSFEESSFQSQVRVYLLNPSLLCHSVHASLSVRWYCQSTMLTLLDWSIEVLKGDVHVSYL